MSRLLVLTRQLQQKFVGEVDNNINTIDIVSPQKTTIEIPLNNKLNVGDLVVLSSHNKTEYIGIIQETEHKDYTKLFTMPLISITDTDCILNNISGGVVSWITNALSTNFVNTADTLFNLALQIVNNTTQDVSLTYELTSANLFDALITIFKKTGVYTTFDMTYTAQGRPDKLICNIYNANEQQQVSIRDDNPLLIEKPKYEFDYNGTNKLLFKPSDTGNVYAMYLLTDNTITANADAEGRIEPVVQEIVEYDSTLSESDRNAFIANKATEILLGNVNEFNISLKVKANENYLFTIFRKINLYTRDGLYEAYITRVDSHNDEYYDLTLGLIRNTLTDKLKAITKNGVKSSGSSSGGGGGGVTPNDAILTIQRNSVTLDTFTANSAVDKTINIQVPTTAGDVNALPSTTKYGASISLTLNSTTYVMTAQLKDQDGNNLGTAQTIDLPLESIILNAQFYHTYTYDGTTYTDVVVITLSTTSVPTIIPVGDLVSGLQTEITPNNKLDADLIDDTNSTNKFVTATDKANWNNKVDKTNTANKVYGTDSSGNQTTWALANASNVGNAVAKYDTAGRLKAYTPSATDDVTNKQYVDNLKADTDTELTNLEQEISMKANKSGTPEILYPKYWSNIFQPSQYAFVPHTSKEVNGILFAFNDGSCYYSTNGIDFEELIISTGSAIYNIIDITYVNNKYYVLDDNGSVLYVREVNFATKAITNVTSFNKNSNSELYASYITGWLYSGFEPRLVVTDGVVVWSYVISSGSVTTFYPSEKIYGGFVFDVDDIKQRRVTPYNIHFVSNTKFYTLSNGGLFSYDLSAYFKIITYSNIQTEYVDGTIANVQRGVSNIVATEEAYYGVGIDTTSSNFVYCKWYFTGNPAVITVEPHYIALSKFEEQPFISSVPNLIGYNGILLTRNNTRYIITSDYTNIIEPFISENLDSQYYDTFTLFNGAIYASYNQILKMSKLYLTNFKISELVNDKGYSSAIIRRWS